MCVPTRHTLLELHSGASSLISQSLANGNSRRVESSWECCCIVVVVRKRDQLSWEEDAVLCVN